MSALEEITEAIARDRRSGPFRNFIRDNPGIAPLVVAYLNGGPRPEPAALGENHYAHARVRSEDARRLLLPVPPPPPPPPSGREVFSLGFESGLDGWTVATPPSVPVSVGAEGGVVPVAGSRMGRFQVRPGEYAPWGATMQASLVQTQTHPLCQLGSVVTMSGTLYIVPGFEWKSNHMHPVFAEYHGWAGMSQAPFHFGINTFTGDWFVDLHRQAAGYNPVLLRNLGPHEQGVKTDWKSEIDWKADSSGRFKFWLKRRDGNPITDSDLKVDWSGRTWNEAGVGVYPVICIYRPAGPTFTDRSFGVGTVYHDDIRGTSVEPLAARFASLVARAVRPAPERTFDPEPPVEDLDAFREIALSGR